MAKMMHCSICGKPVAKMSLSLEKRFDKLRHHRKLVHPEEHAKSIKKGMRTKMKK